MADVLRNWRVELGFTARAAWAWWCGELIGLMPERARHALAGLRKRLLLIIDGDTATLAYEAGGRCETLGPVDLASGEPSRAAALLTSATGKRDGLSEIILRLDPDCALRSPMTLPSAALANLGQVIAFEFERYSPFRRDTVYFAHRVVARDVDAERLHIELTIVQRNIVEDLLARARRIGLRTVGVEVAGSALPVSLNERPGFQRPIAHRLARVAPAILIGLATLLAIAAVAIPILQAKARIASLTDQVAQVRRQADASAQLEKDIESEIQDGHFVVARRRELPTVTEMLGTLTHLLPDDSWLTELQIDGDAVQISGFATSATAMLGVLDQSPILSNAAFRSSVMQEAKLNRERFDITAQLRRRPDR